MIGEAARTVQDLGKRIPVTGDMPMIIRNLTMRPRTLIVHDEAIAFPPERAAIAWSIGRLLRHAHELAPDIVRSWQPFGLIIPIDEVRTPTIAFIANMENPPHNMGAITEAAIKAANAELAALESPHRIPERLPGG